MDHIFQLVIPDPGNVWNVDVFSYFLLFWKLWKFDVLICSTLLEILHFEVSDDPRFLEILEIEVSNISRILEILQIDLLTCP